MVATALNTIAGYPVRLKETWFSTLSLHLKGRSPLKVVKTYAKNDHSGFNWVCSFSPFPVLFAKVNMETVL